MLGSPRTILHRLVPTQIPRACNSALFQGFVQTPKDDNGNVRAVSKVKYINGLKIATGTEDGRIIIYDLRQTRPLVVKDHMYELPINEIHFNEGSDPHYFDRFIFIRSQVM